jgi:hypothetical protein
MDTRDRIKALESVLETVWELAECWENWCKSTVSYSERNQVIAEMGRQLSRTLIEAQRRHGIN